MVTKTDKLLKEFIKLHPKYIDLSLNRLHNLLKKLGSPHKNLPPTIHIAGTNGKGSVLSYIKSCLLMDKQKVNAFTSPHLIKITERILIDNKFVDEEFFVITYQSLLTKLNQQEIVFFEFMLSQLLLLTFISCRFPQLYFLCPFCCSGFLTLMNYNHKMGKTQSMENMKMKN